MFGEYNWGGGDLLFNRTVLDAINVDKACLQGLLVLALHAVLDGFEDIVDGSLRCESRLGALLEHASTHKNRVPAIFGTTVELVGTADVRLRCVAYKVDGIRWRVDAVSVPAPLL